MAQQPRLIGRPSEGFWKGMHGAARSCETGVSTVTYAVGTGVSRIFDTPARASSPGVTLSANRKTSVRCAAPAIRAQPNVDTGGKFGVRVWSAGLSAIALLPPNTWELMRPSDPLKRPAATAIRFSSTPRYSRAVADIRMAACSNGPGLAGAE